MPLYLCCVKRRRKIKNLKRNKMKQNFTKSVATLLQHLVETWHAASLQNGSATINVSTLLQGVYLVRVGNKTAKFIKN
jgi:hypothetical protein